MCTAPLVRAEKFETYRNKQGGISYFVDWLQRDQYDRNFCKELVNHGVYRRINLIPCGQCIDCRLNYSREWATRLMLEQRYGYVFEVDEEGEPKVVGAYPDGTCWFLTLTYADEYLRTHKTVNTETGEINEGTTVYKKDFQDFMKRLRKAYPYMKIKYYHCGEYGKQTLRPHYHAIIFGLPLEQDQFIKVGMSKDNTPRWKLQKLTDIWGLGLVDIGRVTWESCAYVARYSLKKALYGKDEEYMKAQGRMPEYVTMSQGLGKQFYIDNKENIYLTDSVPIANKKTGEKVLPPKAFDRMLKAQDPKLYEKIKQHREIVSESNELIKRTTTDLSPEQRRKISEERMKKVMADLRDN